LGSTLKRNDSILLWPRQRYRGKSYGAPLGGLLIRLKQRADYCLHLMTLSIQKWGRKSGQAHINLYEEIT